MNRIKKGLGARVATQVRNQKEVVCLVLVNQKADSYIHMHMLTMWTGKGKAMRLEERRTAYEKNASPMTEDGFM